MADPTLNPLHSEPLRFTPSPAETLMAKLFDAGIVTVCESGYVIVSGGAVDVSRDEAIYAGARIAAHSFDAAAGDPGADR